MKTVLIESGSQLVDAPPVSLFRVFSRLERTNHQWDRLELVLDAVELNGDHARLSKIPKSLKHQVAVNPAIYVMLAEENTSRQE